MGFCCNLGHLEQSRSFGWILAGCADIIRRLMVFGGGGVSIKRNWVAKGKTINQVQNASQVLVTGGVPSSVHLLYLCCVVKNPN